VWGNAAESALGAAAGRGPCTAAGADTGVLGSPALAFPVSPPMVSTVAATLVVATTMRETAAG
jgi:hypothetical protein